MPEVKFMLDIYASVGNQDEWHCDIVYENGNLFRLGTVCYPSAIAAMADHPGVPVYRIDKQDNLELRIKE